MTTETHVLLTTALATYPNGLALVVPGRDRLSVVATLAGSTGAGAGGWCKIQSTNDPLLGVGSWSDISGASLTFTSNTTLAILPLDLAYFAVRAVWAWNGIGSGGTLTARAVVQGSDW